MSERYRFNTYGPIAQVDRVEHVIYGVSAMQAVEAIGHRLMVDTTSLMQFAKLANSKRAGLKSRFTHPGLSADGLGKHLGRMRNFRVTGDKVIGDLHFSEAAAKSPHGDLRAYVETLAEDDPEAFGMSVVVDGYGAWQLADGTEVEDNGVKPDTAVGQYPALRIVEAYAVDAVDEPAANRDGLFGAFANTTSALAAKIYNELDRKLFGYDVEGLITDYLETGDMPVEIAGFVADYRQTYDIDEDKARVFAAHYLAHRQRQRRPMSITLAATAAETHREIEHMDEKEVVQVAAQPQVTASEPDLWLKEIRKAGATAKIQASGLPATVQARLARAEYETPTEVDAAIEEARAELAALQESMIVQIGNQPPRGLHVVDAMDEARQHVNWFFGAADAKLPPANMRRFDQLYAALTGDYDFRGVFDPTRLMFSGANTTSLVNLVVDAMNKVIVQQMMRLDHWRWYERVTKVEANDGTLNSMKWITLGGVSNLPTVAEGAAYTELDVDDAKETASFVKKGGYVGITREAIKNSNIQQLQAIPLALANAAVRTRSAAVSNLFTSNSGVGPTLAQDSIALFDTSTHKNLLTTALGTDATAWRAARAECFQHTEVQSGAVLGIYPKFLLVPAELYDTALAILGYGEGMPTTFAPEALDRGFADPRAIPLTVPDWTDATDWAYIVDPAVYPVIQMSYSQSPGGGQHPAPEVFSVVSETSGLMFTNDILPVKVRDEFAVGVNGPRGIGKRNVSN